MLFKINFSSRRNEYVSKMDLIDKIFFFFTSLRLLDLAIYDLFVCFPLIISNICSKTINPIAVFGFKKDLGFETLNLTEKLA